MNIGELRSYILLIAGRIMKWSTVTGLSSKWGYLRLSLPPVDQAEGEQANTQPARNMLAFGVRSAPVAGSEVIVAAPRAGATNATVVASDHLGFGPTDLAEGDTVLYSSAHKEGVVAIVRVYADGNIRVQTSKDNCHVIAKPGTGGKVKLGDDADANLDPVVLYTGLKTQFDEFVSFYNNHTHVVPGAVGGGGGLTSSSTVASAAQLTSAAASSNVVAKKP